MFLRDIGPDGTRQETRQGPALKGVGSIHMLSGFMLRRTKGTIIHGKPILLIAHQIAADQQGNILTALKGSKKVAADSLAVRKEQLEVGKEIAAFLAAISSTLTDMSEKL
ncbi:hypothetical protein LQW54_007449 [Pestalotiopsis sp. IQ-011]